MTLFKAYYALFFKNHIRLLLKSFIAFIYVVDLLNISLKENLDLSTARFVMTPNVQQGSVFSLYPSGSPVTSRTP